MALLIYGINNIDVKFGSQKDQTCVRLMLKEHKENLLETFIRHLNVFQLEARYYYYYYN